MQELEIQLKRLGDENDCGPILSVISNNEEQQRKGTQYELDHLLTTRLKAECYEQLGDNTEAALMYGRLGFFLTPHPFKVKGYSHGKIESARKSTRKAISLEEDKQRIKRLELRLRQLDLQEQQVKAPESPILHRKLCDVLRQQKVYYRSECP